MHGRWRLWHGRRGAGCGPKGGQTAATGPLTRSGLALVTFCCGMAYPALADTAGGVVPGPLLVGDASRPECRLALDMAEAAFAAPQPDLDWPIQLPEGKIVLARKALDISGGDGAASDPAVFQRLTMASSGHLGLVVHWQRVAHLGQRLVVVDTPFNWRGNWYHSFLVDQAVSITDFQRLYQIAAQQDFRAAPPGPPPLGLLLGDNRWQVPTILHTGDRGALWLLDQRNGMRPWQVHVPEGHRLIQPCRVLFPGDPEQPLQDLPPAVRRFAALADQALGPGHDEGGLQPTAAIRRRVAAGWLALAHRPWALSGGRANSRAEVEAGLEVWAKGVLARGRLLRKLRCSLDPAGQELARFLQARFDLTATEAQSFSLYAIDHMLRRHFVFHSETGRLSDPAPPPWPASRRWR